MSSRMASSSRPSSATCSSDRWAAAGGRTSGLPVSARAPVRFLTTTAAASEREASSSAVSGFSASVVIWWLSSEVEVHGPGGCRDTRLDKLAGLAVDLAGAKVTDLAGPQGGQAAVANSHPAAAGHQHAGVFADIQQGRGAVGVDLAVGRLKGDQAAVVPLAAAQVGAEAFDRQGRARPVGNLRGLGFPQGLGIVQEPFRAA